MADSYYLRYIHCNLRASERYNHGEKLASYQRNLPPFGPLDTISTSNATLAAAALVSDDINPLCEKQP